MSAVETYPFGFYSVRPLDRPNDWRRLRLLCSDCAEARHINGESVRFIDPITEGDEHKDCSDCAVEWSGGEVIPL